MSPRLSTRLMSFALATLVTGLLLNGIDFFGWRAMLSAAHTADDIERTANGFANAIGLLRVDGLLS